MQAQRHPEHGAGDHGKRRHEALAESGGQPRGVNVERGEDEQRDGALRGRADRLEEEERRGDEQPRSGSAYAAQHGLRGRWWWQVVVAGGGGR